MEFGFKNVISFTLVYLREGDKVLLLKKAKGKSHEGEWIGLGGKLESNEDPLSCAVREFREESGLILGNPKMRGTLVWIEETFLGIIYIFTATKYTGQMTESVEGSLGWHRIDDLWKLEGLAEHQRWFLDHMLNDEGYFYSGAAVYQDGGWVRYADSEDASFVCGDVRGGQGR